MMRYLIFMLVLAAGAVQAQGNLDISTPAIAQLKASMADRHPQMKPHYDSGAIGLVRDGSVALREPSLVPLAQRAAVSALVAAENSDRAALYREIARANGNPGWEPDIRATFGQRWAERAAAGWWVQGSTGAWQQK